MGYIAHHAIIVTSWDAKRCSLIREKASKFFPKYQISEVLETQINGYCSFLIGPDGSKEGWEESNRGNTQRESFIDWLEKRKNGEPYGDYVLVRYGGDEEGLSRVEKAG